LTWQGHAGVLNLLANYGANLHARDRDGETPLHWAALRGHRDAADKLLQRGADLLAVNEALQTPLHWAARKGMLEVRIPLDHPRSTYPTLLS
jgi:hypothetical protein